MKKALLTLLVIGFFSHSSFSQTTLDVGDASILWYSASPDEFGFVTFVDLAVNTRIYFNENGASATGVFDTGEGVIEFLVTTAIPAGTITAYNDGANGTWTTTAGSLGLANSGDQLFIFQDGDGVGGSTPQTNPVFIMGFNAASRSKLDNCSFIDNMQTNSPSVLTPVTFGDGRGTYLALGAGTGCESENDNLYYSGALNFADTAAAKTAILDPDNWTGSTGAQNTAYQNGRDALIAAGTVLAASSCPTTLFVDSTAAPGGDGLSWATAFNKLQDALTYACNIDSIFVSKGTYYPDEGVGFTDNARDSSFRLRDSVVLLGGFCTATGDTTLVTRDWVGNQTILSGEIGLANDITDNSFHVVTSNGLDSASVINGFTITDGYADGGSIDGGGGIFVINSNSIFINLKITDNYADRFGGGMYIDNSSPKIINTEISNNRSHTAGGMLNINNSSPLINNVSISNNLSISSSGGGIFNSNSSPLIINSIIENNSASNNGGGVYNFMSSPILKNVQIIGNVGQEGGGIDNRNNSSPLIENTVISGNHSRTNGGGIHNLSSSPTMTNVVISGNYAEEDGGGIYNEFSFPSFFNATISGNNSEDDGGGVFNFGSSEPKFSNTIIWNNCIRDNFSASSSSIVNANSNSIFTNSLIANSRNNIGIWRSSTGIDSGFNKDTNPLFVDSLVCSLAPSTAGNFRLQSASPAINMGSNDSIMATGVMVDLDSMPRILQGIVDMGAYEQLGILCPTDTVIACDSPTDTMSLGSPSPLIVMAPDSFFISDDSTGFNPALLDDTLGVITRYFILADTMAGTFDTLCTQRITVIDTTAPTAVCQDITVYLDNMGMARIDSSALNNGSSDNCTAMADLEFAVDTPKVDCSDIVDPSAGSAAITELFISEYIEGSGNNKCVEIYNGTGASVNLSSYSLEFYFGGNISAGTTIPLTGTVADGDVYVVCDNDAASAFTDEADLLPTSSFFNGDDAIALLKSGVRIDIFGSIGQDPGTQWSVSGNNTANQTLVRNPDVLKGYVINASGFPALGTEWTEFPSNTSSNLGSHTVNLPPPAGEQVRLFVSDAAGNMYTCMAGLTVLDTLPPTLSCQNITVYLDENGMDTISISDVVNSINDNCELSDTSISKTTFDCADIGNTTVTVVAEDINGNKDSCTQNVSIQDTLPPTAICQDVVVYLDDNGNARIDSSAVNNGSADNCSDMANLALSVNMPVVDCDDLSQAAANPVSSNDLFISEYIEGGSNNKCIEIYNGTGSSVNLSGYVLRFYFNGSGSPGTTIALSGTVADGDVHVVCDNNAGATFLAEADQTSTSGFFSGDDAVELVNDGTAIDIFGRIGEDPGDDWEVNGNSSQNQTLVRAPNVMDGNTDNSPGFPSLGTEWIEFPQDDASNLGSHTVNPQLDGINVTLTVTDEASNEDTCTAEVFVLDTTPPTPVCQDVTVYLDGNGNASIDSADVDGGSTDNCGVESLTLDRTDFDCSDVSKPSNLPPSAWINEFHYDNSGTDQNEFVEIAGTAGLDLTGWRVFLYDGSSGQFYDVDLLSGTLADQSNGIGFQVITYATNGIQNGPDGIALVDDSDNLIEFLSYEGTFTATNGPADDSTSTNVGVSESSSTPSGTSISRTGTGSQASDFSFETGKQQTQNAPNEDQAFLPANGEQPVTIIVTDPSGNQDSCTSLVTVRDTTPPTVSCPAEITVDDNCGQGSNTVDFSLPEPSDNCADVSVSANFMSGASFDTGTTVVIVTATDASENTDTCSFRIIVEDQRPTIVISNVVNPSCPTSNDGSFGVTITDDCGASYNITVGGTTFFNVSAGRNVPFGGLSGSVSGTTYVVQIALAAAAGCDFSAACVASISDSLVLMSADMTPPVADCQDITIYLDDTGNAVAEADSVDMNSTDNCGITSRELTTTDFDCMDLGDNLDTLILQDASGNADSCTATVTVLDTTPPAAICQDLTIYLGMDGDAMIAAADINAGSTDNCGVDSLAISLDSFSCAEVGANSITFTVFDASGNTDTCTPAAIVTVVDTIPPSITFCPGDTMVMIGEPTDTMALDFAEAMDNCSIDSIGFRDDSTGFENGSPIGVITRTFFAVDVNGNVDSSCQQDIIIEGNNLRVRVLLSGPLGLNSGSNPPVMWDSLRTKGFIPLSSPYGTGETISDSATTFADYGNNSIVDWVLIELRNRTDNSQVVTARSALVQRDGDVVDTNGVAAILFDMADLMGQDSFYVAVRHRNHLGAMTDDLYAVDGSLIDFTDVTEDFYSQGFAPQDSIPWLNQYALWPGNANQDAQVDRDDEQALVRSKVVSDADNLFNLLNYIRMGYCPEDVNMDGSVIYAGQRNDIDVIMDAIYRHPQNGSDDPGFVIPEQLPSP